MIYLIKETSREKRHITENHKSYHVKQLIIFTI